MQEPILLQQMIIANIYVMESIRNECIKLCISYEEGWNEPIRETLTACSVSLLLLLLLSRI